jgi:hypothetical protein
MVYKLLITWCVPTNTSTSRCRVMLDLLNWPFPNVLWPQFLWYSYLFYGYKLVQIPLVPPPPGGRDFRRSHFRRQVSPRPYDARDPSSEKWNCGREYWPNEFCLTVDIHVSFRDLLHAANLWHGTDGYTCSSKEGVLRIFSPWKILTSSAGFEPANLCT